MTKSLPLVSIITPPLNSAAYLDAAITSVVRQNYPDIEQLVVDGGSTDGTVSITRNYKHITLIQDTGSGIYSAINRGIQSCHGEIIGLLNSDDLYAENALQTAVAEFGREAATDIVYGTAEAFEIDHRGRERSVLKYPNPASTGKILENMMFGVPVINACFIRRRVFDELGGFNTQFRLAADREFLIRAILVNMKIRCAGQVLYRYRIHDDSLTLNKKASNARVIGYEHMALAREFMQASTDPRLHRLCERWYRVSTVTAIAGALREYKLIETAKIFLEQWARDLIWPLRMLGIVIEKVARRIKNLAGQDVVMTIAL